MHPSRKYHDDQDRGRERRYSHRDLLGTDRIKHRTLLIARRPIAFRAFRVRYFL
jgi:hypothetical protein